MREWEQYQSWLVQKVCGRRKRYNQLMSYLHRTDFVSRIGRDANREDDGMQLRNDFCEENNLPLYLFDYQRCSVLEMLAALAIRIDDEYIGDPNRPDPGNIFWEMIQNLELDHYTDRRFEEKEVHNIVHKWLFRDFDPNGDGSIFPLKYARKDQTKIEIWDQMNAYISENYD